MSIIRKIEDTECEKLYLRMQEDFPPSELIPYSNVVNNVKNGIFDAMYLSKNGVDVAYSILTALDGMDYVVGNYLAVNSAYRGNGYGSEFLKIILEKYHGKIILIEVEDPQASNNEKEKEMRENRIRFYNNAGFRIVPTKKANILGVPMLIMANTDKIISNVREIIHTIYSASLEPQLLEFIDIVNMDD